MQVFVATLYPYSQIFLRNLGYSQSMVGVFLALTQLAACFVPMLVSNMADKTGKTKLFYVLCTAAVLLNHLIVVTWAKTIVILIFFTLAYASSSSMSSLSDTMINRTIAQRKLKGNYAGYRATGTMAYVITLTIFTLVKFPDSSNNSQILIGLAGSCILLSSAILLTPNPETSIKIKKNDKFFDVSWFDRSFYYLISIVFVKSIANSVIDKLLGSYMTEVLNLGSRFTIFVALGALSEFVFMLLAGRWVKNGKITEFQLLKLSCIGLFTRLALYSISTNLYVFAFAQLFHSLTYAASHVAMMSYISKNIKSEHIGLATALYQAIAMNSAHFIGALCGGFIIDYLGYTSLFRIYMVFPAIAFILCLINPLNRTNLRF